MIGEKYFITTFFFVAVAFCCFGISNAAFDETYAKQMINFAAASFIAPQTVNNTVLAKQCFEKSFPNGQWEESEHSSIKPCAGYFNDECQLIITRSVPLNLVVIAFRGTVGEDQMKDETSASLKSYIPWKYDESVGHVNRYFFDASESLWGGKVEYYLKTYKTYKFAFTGHSLGGAIASLIAFKARQQRLVNNTSLYTFGEPRIGNKEFATNFRKYVPESYRIIHNSDLVPHMPLCAGALTSKCKDDSASPYHQPQEIWYNNDDLTMDNSKFTTCDPSDGEDPKCKAQICIYIIMIINWMNMDQRVAIPRSQLDYLLLF
uniref:Fungal lipase-like domain-containing protein n=1 Tax=Panagrolaimus superbus TaxID=310955 RepID=A0A914YDJ6_9BILA